MNKIIDTWHLVDRSYGVCVCAFESYAIKIVHFLVASVAAIGVELSLQRTQIEKH